MVQVVHLFPQLDPYAVGQLRRIESWPNQSATLRRDLSPKAQALLQQLTGHGLVKVGLELCGPLGTPTGFMCVALTERGRMFLTEN